jgi:hypothetical protein
MNTDLIQTNTGDYLRVTCSKEVISTEQSVLSLLGSCADFQTHHMLITQDCLHPDFFNLKTGLAGIFFQKLATYQVKTALVGDWAQVTNKRFNELMYESRQSNQIRFFQGQAEAEQWLTS